MNVYNTFEPYDDNMEFKIEYKSDDNKECFICMENTNNHMIIELIKIKTYIKYCQCNAYVHMNCFDKWINIKSKCPICRKKMKKIIKYQTNSNDIFLNLTFPNIRNRIFHALLLGVKIFIIFIIYFMIVYFDYIIEIHNTLHRTNLTKSNNITNINIIYNITNEFNHSNYHN